MVVTDPIADLLTRIRNALTAKHETVDVPASKMKMSIAEILVNEGYLKSAELVEEDGYMYLVVPDEDLYEKGHWPSIFNTDHKYTFTIAKRKSWSPKSINLLDLLKNLPNCKILKIELQDDLYDYSLTDPNIDQTMKEAMAQIAIIMQKKSNNVKRIRKHTKIIKKLKKLISKLKK